MNGFVMSSIAVGVIIAIIFVCCVLCISCCFGCKNGVRHQSAAYNAPVVVTSTTHTAPSGYTVAQMPIGSTTTTYQTQVYAAPYPPQGAPTHMPMPMPMNGSDQPPTGFMPHVAPYPPMPASAANMNPPPYDVAVSGFGSGAANNQSSYTKQSAYNPNFSM